MSNALELAFFLSNAGARGGLLEYVRVGRVVVFGGVDPFWIGMEQARGPFPVANPNASPLDATAIEGADVQTIFLFVVLQQRGGSIEEQARQIRDLESVAVTIEWAFFRTRRFSVEWASLRKGQWPRRRRRQRIVRAATVEIDARGYRDETVTFWKSSPAHHRLVEIAEGRAEPE